MKKKNFKTGIFTSLVTLIILISYLGFSSTITASTEKSVKNPWGDFQIVNYLYMTANQTFYDKAVDLQNELKLTDAEVEKIKELAFIEAEKLFYLKNESDQQLRHKENSDETKRLAFDYNSVHKDIVDQTLMDIATLLGEKKYNDFTSFLRSWWIELNRSDSKFNQQLNKEISGYLSEKELSSSNWIQVFATQYIGHTTDEVALPDKYIKFANLNYYGSGWPTPPSYYNNAPYLLPIKYNNKQVTKKILEVGPWNENDNYWDPNYWSVEEPNIRRIYSILHDLYNLDVCDKFPGTLSRYKPEADAAYNDGYFCGYDERGRKTNGAGIDLTPQVAEELGISKYSNVWLNIDVGNLP